MLVSRACLGINVIEINIKRKGTKKSAAVSTQEYSFIHKNKRRSQIIECVRRCACFMAAGKMCHCVLPWKQIVINEELAKKAGNKINTYSNIGECSDGKNQTLDCSLLFYQLISLFTSLWCLTFALNVVLNLPTIIILDTAIMMITNISNRLLLCVELPTEFSMFVSLWGDLYSFVILRLNGGFNSQ